MGQENSKENDNDYEGNQKALRPASGFERGSDQKIRGNRANFEQTKKRKESLENEIQQISYVPANKSHSKQTYQDDDENARADKMFDMLKEEPNNQLNMLCNSISNPPIDFSSHYIPVEEVGYQNIKDPKFEDSQFKPDLSSILGHQNDFGNPDFTKKL